MSSHPLRSFFGWLLLVAAAAALGSLGSRDAPAFYAQLTLPAWAPPASWFGPVWTVLYAMMAVAAWLVWRTPMPRTGAIVLFCLQLAVNVLWSWLFFAWREGEWAVAGIVALDVLVLATMVAFWRVRPFATVLLLPYLAWILFATALTTAAWRLNPALL